MKTLILTLVLTAAFFAAGTLYFGGRFDVFVPKSIVIMTLVSLAFQFIAYDGFLKKAFAAVFEKAVPADHLLSIP